jgi:hypothetical protein
MNPLPDEHENANPFAPPQAETSTRTTGGSQRISKPRPAAGLNALLGMSGILSALGLLGFSGGTLFKFGLVDAVVSALGLGFTIATWRGSVTGYVGLLVQTCIAGALMSYAAVGRTAIANFLPLKALLVFALFASLLSFHRRFLPQRGKAGDN